MKIHWNEKEHLNDFIKLNKSWIEKYFELEDVDRKLFENPVKVFNDGGFILTITEDGNVVGTCALFKDTQEKYELARMAVAESQQGRGIGKILMVEALDFARIRGMKKIFLVSNTKLKAAIGLYKKFGFETTFKGQHTYYKRGDIVMEKDIS